MSEDGELSQSPNAVIAEEDPDDSFVIDRSFSGIIPHDDLEAEKSPEEATLSDEASSELKKQESESSSEWQRQMRKRLFGEPEEPATDEPKVKRRRTNLCFNCRGEHSISQCPEPKDFAAIRKNKAEFLGEKQQEANKRISKIAEKDMKFKPGRLSQSLRNALNLGSDDIPEWIYRMRRMGFHKGYPPGYLQKSLKHEFGTLKIYSDQANDTDEDVIDEEARPAPTVQQDKIHFYMGFNKTYGALRDRERGQFEVPPFDVFCNMLQTEVTRDHEYSEKNRIQDDRQRREEILKLREEQRLSQGDQETKDEEEDDDIVIDRSKVEGKEVIVEKEATPEPQGK
uniref:PSP domain-containing protein n=1 Tax=Caenorhabditis tropicalis TaxID=1561998 RepID=A0A1I7T552_9PELO